MGIGRFLVWVFSVIFFSLAGFVVQAGDQVMPISFDSGEQRVQLVELYTSQGCSSCPPADRWLNEFHDDSKLWKTVVPVAFHVDYWDYLGWRDIYANPTNSDRQRRYRRQGNIRAVYTPGFVVNGSEWRGWFARSNLPSAPENPGTLKATLVDDQLAANFTGDAKVLNVAVLGFGISTPVKAGENEGRQLAHEFVVLNHERHRGNDSQWQIAMPKVNIRDAKRFALALWVDAEDKQSPIQATGGWLPKEAIVAR